MKLRKIYAKKKMGLLQLNKLLFIITLRNSDGTFGTFGTIFYVFITLCLLLHIFNPFFQSHFVPISLFSSHFVPISPECFANSCNICSLISSKKNVGQTFLSDKTLFANFLFRRFSSIL